jgi:hypothetical protein
LSRSDATASRNPCASGRLRVGRGVGVRTATVLIIDGL